MRQMRSLSSLADDNRPLSRKGRIRGVLMAVTAHGAIIAGLWAVHSSLPVPPETPDMVVTLVQNPSPPPPVAPDPKPADPKPAAAAPKRKAKKVVKPPPEVKPVYARQAPVPKWGPEVSELDLFGATKVGNGSGAGGGVCDMARMVQAALRKDHLVLNAVTGAGGRSLKVWNGDWVRTPGQDGKGIAAVREAILWEVGFAPAACKNQLMQGLVLISMGDGPGSTRLVIGSGTWRWSDLLHAR